MCTAQFHVLPSGNRVASRMPCVEAGLRRLCRQAIFLILAIVIAALQPRPAAAAGLTSTCDQAARHASERTGVPLDVLRAITRTETGRKASGGELTPWPWTVNMEGVGKWFDTRSDALAYARRHHAGGARSFDIGCFQINYRWHGDAFGSVDDMFDPRANALYAARFLLRLHGQTGDWSQAAGAYHSRTQVHATRYRKRFDRIRSALGPVQTARAVAGAMGAPRRNTFPLLRADGTGSAGRLGSLVPGTGRGQSLLTSHARSLGVEG